MRVSALAKKRIIYALGGLLAVLLLALVVFLWKRQQLLNYALVQVKAKVEAKYPVTLTLGRARFTGLKTVEIGGMSLVPTAAAGRAAAGDTLLTARRLQAGLSLRSLFAGRPVFSELQIDQAHLTAHKDARGGNNFSFLLKKKGPAPVARDTAHGRNYGLLLNQVLDATFGNVPGAADFRQFVVSYASPHHRVQLTMPRLSIDEGQVQGRLTASVDSVVNELGVSGTIEPSDDALNLRLFGVNGSVQVPYVPRKFGALVSFDTIRVQLTGKDFKADDQTGGQLTVRGSVAARNFSFFHKRLSSEDIVVHRGQLDFVATLGRGTVSLDPGTRAVLNQLVFHPEIAVRLKPKLAVNLKIDSDPTATNAFFNSLPEGMFDVVAGTAGTGTLAYHLRADVDLARVDSLHLTSSLQPSKDFSITHFGAEDLSMLEREFPFTAYNDKGDSLRTFLVGPSNPDFTPFAEVSPFMPAVIQTTEDPQFFRHHGFMEKAFVNAAIQDIKEKRFARGGSTLSMQLVKNVFLSREKTVGRKAEEMLMVWLIENWLVADTHTLTKERMFEIYLNIVEWGPTAYRWPSGKRGVYGIREAALFYYAKRPSELNLGECIYLASIIPKPKYYRESFNKYGELRGTTRWFFRFIADIMQDKGLITPGQRDNLNYSVSLKGPANKYIVRAIRDTVRAVQPGDTAELAPLNLVDLLNTGATPAPAPATGTPPAPAPGTRP
ncbi:transglycosylase domain-containing protein [Hymenobacter sp. BRD128]|uniref:biosynthetic peptidoglycan transglycosylase n=1 Tax=Hymenobacter sp. BRD128 TaxID=2675878 RepID=UPI0015669346|nr:biosynthetic peptidoglycan transglycosylase [Hymenobacter sp. BRD128]QKG55466.1 transglycosylase domain-containing protein [Hymenobacter sp. BRD128]